MQGTALPACTCLLQAQQPYTTDAGRCCKADGPLALRTHLMPPAAAMWLSFIIIMSYSPIRWGVPPPSCTAHLSSNRRPGTVLRVSWILHASWWRRGNTCVCVTACVRAFVRARVCVTG